MRQRSNADRFARGLGLVSLGLGSAHLAAPRHVPRLVGARGSRRDRAVARAIGMREIALGVAILSRPRPARWLWARVGGRGVDLALLAALLASRKRRRRRAATGMAIVAGVTALDVVAAARLRREAGPKEARDGRAAHVRRSVTVNRPPHEVYGFWHDVENLPRFMTFVESVQPTGEKRSHWKAKAPAGKPVEWDAEIVEDKPSELIAWRTHDGPGGDGSGSVRFQPAPGGRGTEVTVDVEYRLPGPIGPKVAKVATLFGGDQLDDDLHRLKQVIETGEAVVSEARVGAGRIRQRPAQPPAAA